MHELPQMTTTLKNKAFIFRVVAYRQLSKAEMIQQLRVYMKSKRLKRVPTSGEVTVTTLLGAIDL